MIIDGFNAILRALVTWYVAFFDMVHPFAGLAVLSAVIGLGMLWVVGKTSNQRAIGQAKKLMQAHLLEMRLYRDEPTILLRAQGRLILNNLRYVGHMSKPALFLALPMVVLYGHFDAVYGRRPLAIGEPTLVVVETDLPSAQLSLQGSGEMAVDSVPVASASDPQVTWRIRAIQAGTGELSLETPDGSVSKAAVAGTGSAYLSSKRTTSAWQRLLLNPGEPGFDAESIYSVKIAYPSRNVGIGGWETHWAVWFLVISIATAFLCKSYFGVVL